VALEQEEGRMRTNAFVVGLAIVVLTLIAVLALKAIL
jgi:hypothetical protein